MGSFKPPNHILVVSLSTRLRPKGTLYHHNCLSLEMNRQFENKTILHFKSFTHGKLYYPPIRLKGTTPRQEEPFVVLPPHEP